MRAEEKRYFLSLMAVCSAVFAAILCAGDVANFGPTLVTRDPSQYQSYEMRLEGGRVEFWHLVRLSPPHAYESSRPTGWSFNIGIGRPDLKRSVWEFDAHVVPPRVLGQWTTLHLFAFPIWCAVLPCLIVPLLWIRKRRRPPQIGFEVIGNAGKPQTGV